MYFMIVGRSNDPVYEIKLDSNVNSQSELQYLHQFILHSSMDMVASSCSVNPSTFLKVVDRFNAAQVSAYVTFGGSTFLLLHNGRNEESVRRFFLEIHELYVKHLLNPLIDPSASIIFPQFNDFVLASARKL